MILSYVGGLFLQLEVWDLVQSSGPLPKAVMVILLGLLARLLGHHSFEVGGRSAAPARPIVAFLRAFRKAPALDTIAAASEQFRTLAAGRRSSISATARCRAK